MLQHPLVVLQVIKSFNYPLLDRTLWPPSQRLKFPAIKEDEGIITDPTPFTIRKVDFRTEAEVVTDPAEKSRWWKDEWGAFYKDRNRGDDYLLLRVKPTRLEITSEAHGLTNDPQTWLPVIIDLP